MRREKVLSIVSAVILVVVLASLTILGLNSNLSFSNLFRWNKQEERLLTDQDVGYSELTESEEIEAATAVEAIGDVGEIEQLILFECSYSNWAWEFQHDGWFIDNQGNVRTFKVSGDTSRSEGLWNWETTKEDINRNYERTTETIRQIDMQVLKEKYKMMLAIKDGNYSEEISIGADMGKYGYYCYVWNESNQKYDRIPLSIEGDWSNHNLDPNARKLDKWLKNLFY